MSDEALAKIAGYLEQFAHDRDLALPPFEQGVARIQRGSAVVSVHALHEQGVILFLARVGPAPGAGDEARLRELLTASFTATGDAAFALHPETGEIYLRILRAIEGLDYHEFEDLLHTIATVADHWDDRLKAS